MTKLFVGNLPYNTTEQELNDLLAPFGKVLSAKIITDRYSGKSKGFGFVEMENDDDAQKAINELKNHAMGGRNVIVSVARPREDRPERGNFGPNRGR